jgi:hypothetical protein
MLLGQLLGDQAGQFYVISLIFASKLSGSHLVRINNLTAPGQSWNNLTLCGKLLRHPD